MASAAGADDSLRSEIVLTARRRVGLMAATVLDGAFLVVFVAVNYGVSVVSQHMEMGTVDLYAFRALQILLGVSTVGVAAVYLVADTVEAVRRAFKPHA